MDNNENQNVQPAVQNPTPQEVLQNNGSIYTELGQESRHVDTSTLDEHAKKSSPVKIILFVIFLVLFVSWAFLVYSDYGRVKSSQEPSYCVFGTKVDDSKEGTITECYGLGYKVINYKTLDIKMTEFVPIWEKTKTLAELEEK
jgi:hypothetical protein